MEDVPFQETPLSQQPAEQSGEPTGSPTSRGKSGLGGLRRFGVTFLLAAGLLAVGGVAVVNAASPSPSASPGSSATTPANPGGSSTNPGHTCP